MAKYRHVYTNFWSDPVIQEEFTPEDKLFYLYLLTNEHTNQIGIYQITKKQMAFELGYSTESTAALLSRFIDHHQLIKYDATNREIFIMNWAKHNLMKGGKPVLDCVKRDLSEIKSADFIDEAIDSVPKAEIQRLFMQRYESLTSRVTNRTTISGQKEKEKEKEKEKYKEKENEKEKESPKDISSSLIDNSFLELKDYYELKIAKTNFTTDQKLDDLLDEFNDSKLIIEAMQVALAKDKNPLSYSKGILRNWRDEHGITSYEQLAARKENSNEVSTKSNVADSEQLRISAENERRRKLLQGESNRENQ